VAVLVSAPRNRFAGPLPEVIIDVPVAQRRMREKIRDAIFCLMVAATLRPDAVLAAMPYGFLGAQKKIMVGRSVVIP
jgi:hypothetical protein